MGKPGNFYFVFMYTSMTISGRSQLPSIVQNNKAPSKSGGKVNILAGPKNDNC
jgi:hypothetical protein